MTSSDAKRTPTQSVDHDPLKAYFMERRRALLTELAALNKLLGLHKEKLDNDSLDSGQISGR